MEHSVRTIAVFLFIGLWALLLTACEPQVTGPDSNDGEEEEPPDVPSHTLNPGDSAHEYLRDDDFEELVIEVQYMEGYEPTDETLDRIKVFLSDRLHKPEGITVTTLEIEARGQEAYTADDIRDIEEEERTEFNSENTMTAYYIFVDGEYENADVLGIAYYNTSMAIFQEKVKEISGGGTQPSRSEVERTVTKHEFGHILGLVDSGVEMQEDHQENGPHCEDDECLMYYAMTRDFVAEMLQEDNVPELDEYCIQDLQAAGGK